MMLSGAAVGISERGDYWSSCRLGAVAESLAEDMSLDKLLK